MNENLIPECREFTMVEELWPIKKYEGNRPVWDCRNWLIGAIQDEILNHVKQYNHPYILTLSEEPIWTEVEYKNRQDTSYTIGMQKLSPLEVNIIVTPFIRKWYNVYQDEKAKCIKISRKEIPGLKPLELPQDLMREEWEKGRLDEIWEKEAMSATRYMQALLMYRGLSVTKRKESTSTSIKFTVHLIIGNPAIDAEIKVVCHGRDKDPFYKAIIEIKDDVMEKIGYSTRTLESNGSRTAHEAAAWLVRVISNIKIKIQNDVKKNCDNNDR